MKANYVGRLLMFIVVTAVMGLGAAHAAPISTTQLQVDVAGTPDNDERGSASNIVRDFYVGFGALVTAFKWDVELTSNEGSYLSEMQLTFSDTEGNGVTFTPGGGDDFDGTAHYAGFQDLGGIDKIFAVGSDGILRLEFHDYYKDLDFDAPEGVWNAGTLTFSIAQVPEPSTGMLLLGGLLVLARVNARRRTKH